MFKKMKSDWYNGNGWCQVLVPLSWLYRIILWFRRWAYHFHIFRSTSFPVPLIVVGNIAVGGSGKTPLVIALVEYLKSQGYKPGVVSRGYKGTLKSNEVCSVGGESDPKKVGDEPVLIAKRTNVPVLVGANRVQAVTWLLQQFDCDVVISDDGLQHLAMKRAIEIAVMDLDKKSPYCFPAGPLREPLSRLTSVDFKIGNGCVLEEGFSMTIIAKNWYEISNPSCVYPLDTFFQRPVHAVAGIAHPERFFKTLDDLNISYIPHAFPDHFAFKETDVHFGNEDEVVLMTEKDAVKCVKWHGKFLALRVDAELPVLFFERLSACLKDQNFLSNSC